jgi:hypothetical protein
LISEPDRFVRNLTLLRGSAIPFGPESEEAEIAVRDKMASSTSTLPPDLFDQTTLVSLTATVVILAVAYGASQRLLSSTTPNSLRILFIWHFFDFLVHFNIEGSLLYHCFFTSIPAASVQDVSSFYPSPYNYLGTTDRIWGPQAGDSFTAKMWMIYARADKRWAGADLVRLTEAG